MPRRAGRRGRVRSAASAREDAADAPGRPMRRAELESSTVAQGTSPALGSLHGRILQPGRARPRRPSMPPAAAGAAASRTASAATGRADPADALGRDSRSRQASTRSCPRRGTASQAGRHLRERGPPDRGGAVGGGSTSLEVHRVHELAAHARYRSGRQTAHGRSRLRSCPSSAQEHPLAESCPRRRALRRAAGQSARHTSRRSGRARRGCRRVCVSRAGPRPSDRDQQVL